MELVVGGYCKILGIGERKEKLSSGRDRVGDDDDDGNLNRLSGCLDVIELLNLCIMAAVLQ